MSNPELFTSSSGLGPHEGASEVSTTITLRDLFAAFALVALVPQHLKENAAEGAYNYADAMLAERERTK